jgi:hypothetical protein
VFYSEVVPATSLALIVAVDSAFLAELPVVMGISNLDSLDGEGAGKARSKVGLLGVKVDSGAASTRPRLAVSMGSIHFDEFTLVGAEHLFYRFNAGWED